MSSLVASQFDDLAAEPVRHLAKGQDHAVFEVGDAWIFRLPRRADRVAWLQREVGLLDVVGDALGRLSASFPYLFVGYRRVPGVPCTGAPAPTLADGVASFLARLHGLDPRGVPRTQLGCEDEPGSTGAEQGSAARSRVVDVLALPYLDGEVAPPPPAPSRRLVHNDLCAWSTLPPAGSPAS